jgi:hypothetical protein
VIALLIVLATSGATWVEITSGLRPNDDISAVGYGDDPDDIFVGTTEGFVYRTKDGGETYDLIFEPRDFDAKRDKPLLASVITDPSRLPSTVSSVERCGGVLFLVTPATLWRSTDDGVRWDRIDITPAGVGSEVWWMSCDGTKPGRLAISTPGGVLESYDWGDAFAMFRNPFPDGMKVDGINFRSDGRLIISQGTQVYRERLPPAEGYERVCEFGHGDGVGSSTISWHWWSESKDRIVLYAVTDDGILVCDDGRLRRFTNEQFGRRPAAFVWLDWTRDGHIFVASDRDVWETWDGGLSFKQVFDAPTQRSIRRLAWKPDRQDDLIVATGGQLFRRLPDEIAAKRRWVSETDQAKVNRALAQAPLWAVVTTALSHLTIEPGQLAAVRTDTTLRALMPELKIAVTYADGSARARVFDRSINSIDPLHRANSKNGRTEWGALLVWDLGGTIYDELVGNRDWANVERLRQQVTFRVQDTWVMWAQATMAMVAPGLTTRQRLYHELKRREAAAYLNQITGEQFEVFKGQSIRP